MISPEQFNAIVGIVKKTGFRMTRCGSAVTVEEWGLLPAGPRVEVRCDLHAEHGGDHIAKLVGLQDETYWIEWEADRASCPEEER